MTEQQINEAFASISRDLASARRELQDREISHAEGFYKSASRKMQAFERNNNPLQLAGGLYGDYQGLLDQLKDLKLEIETAKGSVKQARPSRKSRKKR